MRNRVAQDAPALLGHEKRHPGGDALLELVRGPGVGERGALDGGDVGDVSRPGGTDPVTGGRGAPPTWPALRQGDHTRAPRCPDRRSLAPRRPGRGADRKSTRLNSSHGYI